MNTNFWYNLRCHNSHSRFFCTNITEYNLIYYFVYHFPLVSIGMFCVITYLFTRCCVQKILHLRPFVNHHKLLYFYVFLYFCLLCRLIKSLRVHRHSPLVYTLACTRFIHWHKNAGCRMQILLTVCTVPWI